MGEQVAGHFWGDNAGISGKPGKYNNSKQVEKNKTYCFSSLGRRDENQGEGGESRVISEPSNLRLLPRFQIDFRKTRKIGIKGKSRKKYENLI